MKKKLKISKILALSGFTLVEVLVSLTISGILLTLVTVSYWTFLKQHQQSEISRDLQQESRFALTRMIDKIRNFSLNYEEYSINGHCPPSVNQNQKLCLHEHLVEFRDENLFLDDQPLFSEKKFKVLVAYFSFSPQKDPLKNLGDSDLQIQPKITIFFKIQSKKFENIELKLQTTISSRKY